MRDLLAIAARLAKGVAVHPLPTVPGLLRLDADDAAQVVDELVEQGLAEVWADGPAGASLIVSTVAAERLGVELVDHGYGMRWVKRGSKPRERDLSRWGLRATNETDAFGGRETPMTLDNFVDTRGVGPSGVLLTGKEVIPFPYVVIDPGFVWPTALPPAGPCPVCRGRRLQRHEACVYCDRSGVDHLIRSLPKPKPMRAVDDRPGGVGKAVAGRVKAKPKKKSKAKKRRRAG